MAGLKDFEDAVGANRKQPDSNIRAIWINADGSAGFHTGDRVVQTTRINGLTLFAFESVLSKPGTPVFTCLVAGVTYCNAATMEEAKSQALTIASRQGVRNLGRRVSTRRYERMAGGTARYPVNATSKQASIASAAA